MMSYIKYEKFTVAFSKHLRNHSTLSEVLLWNQLKAGKMRGYKFNRQKPLDRYIVDFYCKKLSLVIEVDGSIHAGEAANLNDKKRQKILESLGLVFLRFDNGDIKFNMMQVKREIENFIENWEKNQASSDHST
jgi:very-short-patch-repair endonuclease